jgi:SAM-dependent methyltransferase
MPSTFGGLARKAARKSKTLHWLAGAVRYVQFERQLREEERAYSLQPATDVPPPRLRHRVHGAFDAESYRQAGEVIAGEIVDRLAQNGIELAGRVLDFGCGPGRVAARVKALAPSAQLFGIDIDGEAIAWARRNLASLAEFERNAPNPPTRFVPRFFDLVYTVSVFTHLDERTQIAWLDEIARVLRPGGAFLATVHGETAWSSCSERELEALRARGFHHRTDRTGRFKLDGLPEGYQTTFHAREYIERVWGRRFQLIEYAPGGLHGRQDIVVMKRREG